MTEEKFSLAERRAALQSLLALDQPIAELRSVLGEMGWYNEELVTLTYAHVTTTLKRFLADELSAETVAAWAELIEMRDDIDMPDQEAVDAIFVLANPVINGTLDQKLATELIVPLPG
jgi:hypothetical protein